jgi:glycosyltransferase involved in cell wall biosynthesis
VTAIGGPARDAVVMVTTSYPRFPGDAIGTFMEPIARGVAARGHDVHMVAPWHPRWRRAEVEDGVRFHLFRYAPLPSLNVFGYAAALRADVNLRLAAVAVTPIAVAAGALCTRRVVRETAASVLHAHWVIPGGVMATLAGDACPLVISLHGSDVFVAERHRVARMAARWAFGRAAWVTACSDDLRTRALALGAAPDRITVVPYGVDSERFVSDPALRASGRAALGVGDDVPLVVAIGRLASKKGFEYLVDAVARLKGDFPTLVVIIAGEGDLDAALRARAADAGVADRVQFPGVVPHQRVPALLASADIAVVPSVHDQAGNVDGLPNTVLEIMASGTSLVATPVGGIASVATEGQSARFVPEQDAKALAAAIADLIRQPALRMSLGREARKVVVEKYSWSRVAEQFDAIYTEVRRDRPRRGKR